MLNANRSVLYNLVVVQKKIMDSPYLDVNLTTTLVKGSLRSLPLLVATEFLYMNALILEDLNFYSAMQTLM